MTKGAFREGSCVHRSRRKHRVLNERRVRHWCASLAFVTVLGLALGAVAAERQYGPGVTDSGIKIGQTMPYSGPASAYAVLGKAQTAYIRMINEHGGINGRKITLISLDDGYSPPKTLEQTRRLVESDRVLGIFDTLGTPPNAAIQEYLNENHVPHFAISGASRFNDPARFPWTMGTIASYETEGSIYGKYILQTVNDPKIGVLYQNDDLGKDYFKGLQEGLGGNTQSVTVKSVSYEVTDPTIDSQIIALKASGANVFFNASTPKFAALAIRKAFDIGWRPMQFLSLTAQSIVATLAPAGVEKVVGIISSSSTKDPNDPVWANDKGVQDFLAFRKAYYPESDLNNRLAADGYALAQAIVYLLQQCGDNLTRENVMHVAANSHDVEYPLLLPGIRVNTSPTNYRGFNQMQLVKFDGVRWMHFGDVVSER
jgi:branched-chain amino acid transport system substrate-binding protein